MTELLFLPITEQYEPSTHKIYLTVFQLGFLKFKLSLLDTSVLNFSKDFITLIKGANKHLAMRYINILTIGGDFGWIWNSNDNLALCEVNYKETIRLLKQGEAVVFKDLGDRFKPLRLSYRALEFIW